MDEHIRRWLEYTVMLGKFRAQLVLPRDLTAGEAARLCQFIRSLIVERGDG